LLLTYSIVIAWSGGIDFTLAGIRLRSRTWQRPAVPGLLCLVIVAIVDRRRWPMTVARLSPSAVALTAAAWTLVAGLAFGTFVAGGADSSGYLNQARLFASGRALDDSRIPERFPLRDAGYTLAPLGFRPAADGARLAPIYPPGYPLLMAPGFLIDGRLAHLIVPLCGALAVWLIYTLGRAEGLPGAGVAAAVLLSLSPTFLYQLVQPMSDVPATTAWLLVFYLARKGTLSAATLSGGAAGIAVLIRPNLLPLAGLACLACAMSSASGRWRRAGAAAAAMIPALVVLGAIQSIRYGSPFVSGYGAVRGLFAWQNVWPNVERYPRWMIETHTPLIALFVLAPLWIARHRAHGTFLLLLWTFAMAVVAAYLPYVYFQMFEWTYTRFLLPAIPMMWLLVAAPIDLVANRIRTAQRAAIGLLIVLLVGGFCLYSAKSRFVFDLHTGEEKYVAAAQYVREALPPNSLLISMQHSGSLWFYTPRPIVRWDYLNPRELDELLAWSAAHRYQPFLVVDHEEFERVTARLRPRAEPAFERLHALAQFGDATIYAFE
jgi:hypothetical protein